MHMTRERAPGGAANGRDAGGRVASAVLPVVVLVALLSVLPGCMAAPKLVVYDIVLSADPPVQAPGLPISLDARIGFGGACCYVVYGTEMKAELVAAGNMELRQGGTVQDFTSPGEPAGTVAAEEGGGMTWLDVHWTISGRKLGNLQVTVRVTGTNDFGDRFDLTRTINLTIATASPPVFPHRPVVGRETPVLVDVPSGANIRSVAMYLSKDNRTWTGIPMKPLSGSLWMASIPATSAETEYRMYIETIDSGNNTNHTTLYNVQVKDPGGRSGLFQDGSAYLLIGALAAAVPLVLLGKRLGGNVRRRRETPPAEGPEGPRGR